MCEQAGHEGIRDCNPLSSEPHFICLQLSCGSHQSQVVVETMWPGLPGPQQPSRFLASTLLHIPVALEPAQPLWSLTPRPDSLQARPC